jgi:Peptidase A4 family
VNSINKSSITFPIAVLALALVAATLSGEGQSRLDPGHASIATAMHAPIQVVPDANGNALLAREAQFISTNWSGYVLPDFATGEDYVSAQATWVVPTVVFKKKLAVSSNWVGIGGFCENMQCKHVDGTLIQLGTTQVAESKKATQYFAWYEMLPGPSINTALVVNPGDVITASLTCDGDCTGSQRWTLSMTNETTTQNWSQDFDYNSSNLSAEWIEEAPSSGRKIVPLANFDTITFDQSMANDVTANLTDADSVVMRDPHGETSNVSELNSTFDGFSACYGPTKKLTPCSFVPLP